MKSAFLYNLFSHHLYFFSMQKTYQILAALCFLAAAAMYQVGSNSSHLSELKDLAWLPLPPGLLLLLVGLKKKK